MADTLGRQVDQPPKRTITWTSALREAWISMGVAGRWFPDGQQPYEFNILIMRDYCERITSEFQGTPGHTYYRKGSFESGVPPIEEPPVKPNSAFGKFRGRHLK